MRSRKGEKWNGSAKSISDYPDRHGVDWYAKQLHHTPNNRLSSPPEPTGAKIPAQAANLDRVATAQGRDLGADGQNQRQDEKDEQSPPHDKRSASESRITPIIAARSSGAISRNTRDATLRGPLIPSRAKMTDRLWGLRRSQKIAAAAGLTTHPHVEPPDTAHTAAKPRRAR